MALLNSKKKQQEYKQHKQGMSTKSKLLIVLAVIIIAVVAYAVFFLSVSQTVVSAPATANLTSAGTIFSINGQQYLISLASISVSQGKAYIHISKLPIFVNPILNVTLSIGNITKINAGTTYADMGVQLQSLSANSATVQVSPLYTSLKISPDSQDISYIQGTLYNSGQSPSQQITTTIASSGSSSTTAKTTTTAASTTTVVATNNTQLDINTALKNNALYGLMLNFSVLYANTSECTSQLYNSTYIYAHGHAPPGPSSYENVSPFVPYNLTISTSNLGSGNFNIAFKTLTQNPVYDDSVAVNLQVNASTKTVTNESFPSTGIFDGLNFTKLRANYVSAIAAGGACGVEV